MPNVVAHMHIAEQMYPGAPVSYLMGAALPDFVGMARDYQRSAVRVRDFVDTPFADGIDLHKRTDAVFDALPLKKVLIDEAKADLKRLNEENRGAALACADAGTEILLDGILLETPEVRAFYDIARQRILRDRKSLAIVDNILPTGMVRNYFSRDKIGTYSNSETVAKLMYRRLATRPRGRLQFNEDALPELARAFARQRLRLRFVGSLLVEQTVRTLHASAEYSVA